MPLHSGVIYNTITDYSGNIPNITTSLNMGIIDGCVRELTPVITPYGFHSVPADNFTAVTGTSAGNTSSVVLGFLNPCSYASVVNPSEVTKTSEQENVQDLKTGESEIFNSFNYALRMEEEKINIKWKDLSSRIANGENVMNLFLEVYAQMSQLINLMNSFWTLYNNHVHVNVDPGTITQTLPPMASFQASYIPVAPEGTIVQPQPFFTTIKDELGTGSGIHIDNNGSKYSNYIAETP